MYREYKLFRYIYNWGASQGQVSRFDPSFLACSFSNQERTERTSHLTGNFSVSILLSNLAITKITAE